MFFLLRTGVWFSLVLLALPLGSLGVGGNGDSVGPIQALMAARDAVNDVAGLCERRPDVCETGRSAMQTIGVRAREGSRIAFELLDERLGAPAQTDAVTTGAVAAADPEVVLPDTAPLPR